MAAIDVSFSVFMIKQYQFVAMDHHRPAAIAEPLFDIVRLAAGQRLCLFVGIFRQAAADIAVACIDERHDITATEAAVEMDESLLSAELRR